MKKLVFTFIAAIITFAVYAQEGAWSGALDIQGTKLPLVFHFDGETCTFDSPAQGARGIKAEKVITEAGKIQVKIPMINAVYEGVLVMNMIAGEFSQNGLSLPLTLKPGEIKPSRPQTPKAPFPYTTEDLTFQNGEYTFKGTLTLPEGYTKNTPVLVMVTGSGLQNRDEELMDHRPFAVIADAVGRHGIATFRFDDRGWEIPSFPFLNFTVSDHKKDAEAAIMLLRKRFNKVGVIGHSEGGTIALMLASEGKVDYAVSLAGMAVSGRETLIAQNKGQLLAAGLPETMTNDFLEALEKAYDHIIAHKSVDGVDDSKVPEILKPNFTAALPQLNTVYMRDFLTVDIRESLNKVKCPVLALNGKKDTQVDFETNLSAIDRGLTKSKHEVVAFEGLNHLFQHCQTGNVTEYQLIEETFAPEALQKIIDWLKAMQ